MPRSLTPLGLSVLALANERPMHPYEMYQLLLDRHEDRLVKVRPGSLYHTVNRLEAEHLLEVTGTEREGNRPQRTTYRITDDGRAALTSALREQLAAVVNEYPRFPQALSEAHNLPSREVGALLTARADALDARRSDRDDVISQLTSDGVPRQYWLDLAHAAAVEETEARWLRNLSRELNAESMEWAGDRHLRRHS